MEAPLRQIVENSGDEGSVVVSKVREGEGSFGYNAATGEYGDMIEMGILDPAKVTRAALQAAASVAGLMITTEVMVADKPAAAGGAPAMPDMGGMGGMGRYGRNDVNHPHRLIKSRCYSGFFVSAECNAKGLLLYQNSIASGA